MAKRKATRPTVTGTVTLRGGTVYEQSGLRPATWKSDLMRALPYGTDFEGSVFKLRAHPSENPYGLTEPI